MTSIDRALWAGLFVVLSLSARAGERTAASASAEHPCVVTLQGCVATAIPAQAARAEVPASIRAHTQKSLSATALTPLHFPQESDRKDFEPTYYAESGSDGVWAIGHADFATLAVKFNGLGHPIAHAYTPIDMQLSFFALRYPDGGLLLAGSAASATEFSACTVQRLAADGRLLWIERMSAFGTEDCGAVGVDASGAIWVYLRHAFPSRLVRLSADGNTVAEVDLAPHFSRDVREMIVDTASPGVLLGGSTLAADGQSIRARILRLDAQGQVTWGWDSQRNQTESEVAAMSVSAAYGVQAVVGIPPSAPDAYARTVRALRLNAAGAQIHDRDIKLDRAAQVEAISAADGAGNWVALRSPGESQPVSMMRLSLSGNAGALHPIGDAERCSGGHLRFLRCRIHLRQDGGAWFQVNYPDTPSHLARYPQLVGIDGDGVERFRQPVFFESRPTLRADDSMLASAVVMYPPGVQVVPVPHIARFGDSMQPWTDVRDLLPSYLKWPTGTFTDRGDAIVVGQYGNQGYSPVSSNSASVEYLPSVDSGELPWRSVYTTPWGGVNYLSVGSQGACFSGTYSPRPYSSRYGLRCHRLADGMPTWQWDSDIELSRRATRQLDDGRSISILNTAGTVEHAVVDIGGQPLSATRVYPLEGYAPEISFNESGDALLRYRNAAGTTFLMSLRADGTQRYKVEVPGTLSYQGAELLRDGRAFIWHGKGLDFYSPNGAHLWSQLFTDVSVSSAVSVSATRVIMQRRSASQLAESKLDQFTAFDLSSGIELWSQRFLSRAGGIPAIAAIDNERIGIVEADDSRLTWRVLDSASGSLLREQSDACGASHCGSPELHLRTDGRASVLMPTWSPQQGRGTQVLGLEHAGDALPAVRADQAGISGAWYAPTSTGQGLMMQWLPSANTLFAPWFTYTKQGGNAHSELRWYTLQGRVTPGAVLAEVGIYQNSGGDFGAGMTSAQRVGSAILRFESCERAHLRYRFDQGFNDDVEGVVTLTRLTPGQACIGATNTAVTTKAASLDADFDGAWFDPAASGQGLMFSRYPSSSGNSGTLFAPWFTFDPAAAADDETGQHWFTLQGIYDGSGQSNLTIFRTTGGSFDATPTGNTHAVGSATLLRTSCDSAALTYRFSDTDIAGRFRGLTGNIALRKAGGCI